MPHDSPIAIIGYAYRAPGVGRKGLWEFLAEAKSAWSSKVPPDRFDQDAFHHPNSTATSGTFSSQGAHFLPGGLHSFDAPFFNLRPEEAIAIDPQHHLALECAFEAAESAGLSLIDLAGANVGVFAAIGSTDYGQLVLQDPLAISMWTGLGASSCMFANRLSYFFNFNGPSISMDAACASSCYAIHMACQSLRVGDCEAAFVPAVIQEKLLLQVHEEVGLPPSETAVVEGHGTGTQVGDPIEASAFATILASERTAANPLYIGSVKSNLGHLENASGMLGVIKAIMMLKNKTMLPNADFVEFNENIEGMEKLKVPETTLPWPPKEKKRVLVTNFGFGGSNAAILLDESPGGINTDKTEGPNGVVFDESNNEVEYDYMPSDPMRQLFVVSAKTESSLRSYMSPFKEYLHTAPESRKFVKDLGFTLGERRTHHPYRAAVIADSVSSLKTQLESCKITKVLTHQTIAYVFTGQGAQHARMAAGLRRYKVFATAMDEAEAHLRAMGASWSLAEELGKPGPESCINDAEISQPACTAVQIALFLLLKSWGVMPHTVTGHSSGEIAAAFAAGLISFQAAMAIAYFRGQAAAQLCHKYGQKGAMVALGTSPERALALIRQDIEGYATIAAVNSPRSVTLSGDESAIENIKRIADADGLFTRRLKVEVAYHSTHMEQVAAYYLESIEPFFNIESYPTDQNDSHPVFVSSVTGCTESAGAISSASHWVKNLLQPVRFTDAVEGIFLRSDKDINTETRGARPPNIIVELGPHSALQNPIKQIIESFQKQSNSRSVKVKYFASLVRGTSGDEALLGLAGNLFSMGTPIAFAGVNQTGAYHPRVVPDLPPYEWDRSVEYVHKSRIAQEMLYPGQAWTPLLGRKSPYGNGSEPTFRSVFTMDDIPWIRDHKVGEQAIFPMTGFLSLAIEAARRVTPKVPGNFLVREFHVKRSLDIDEDERVDITTKLKPAATGTESFSSTAWEFDIRSWTETRGWIAHCYGQIEPEARDMTMESPTLKASALLVGSGSLKEIDIEREYNKGPQEGTHYGPAFRAIRKCRIESDYTIMETVLRDLDISPPWTFGSPVSVDPPTLDSHLQGSPPFQEGRAHIPNYVSRLRISNRIPVIDKQRFTVVTRLVGKDTKAGTFTVSVAVFAQCDGGSLLPVAEWESVTFRSISFLDAQDPTLSFAESYYWDMIPTFDFLANEALVRMASVDNDELKNVCLGMRKVDMAAVYYMDRALKETAGDDLSQMPSHLIRFLNWSKKIVARESLTFDGKTASLLAEVSNYGPEGELICAVGERLVSILRGEVQPLEIMFKDALLTRAYEQNGNNSYGSRVLARLVHHLSNIKPNLSVLEVGAGTASATLPVLEELSSETGELPAFLRYTFTDISAGFFENARVKLGKWTQRITYRKLDIGQDPVQQGFVPENYDVIIASNVLHATPNIAETLDHVRTLLKPNGKLLFIEGIVQRPAALPFALLPGWWLSEDEFRDDEEGPLLSENMWKRVLCSRGFSGVDFAVADFPNTPDHVISVMCSTRKGIDDGFHDRKSITICGPIMDDDEEEFLQMTSSRVALGGGCPSSVKPFMEINPSDEDLFCIFIDSPRHSLFIDLQSETFEALKTILLEAKGLLWVIPANCPPEAESIKGLLHTVRLETGPRNLTILDNVPCTLEGALKIAEVAKRLQDPEFAVGTTDQDFICHKGEIHVPRLRLMTGAADVFAAEAGIPVRKIQNIWQGNDSLEMTIDAAGSPDSIYFRRSDAKGQCLGENEVLIRVEAAGMNFRDLLVVLGSIPSGNLGHEGAGVVTHVGSDVGDLHAGDRVFFRAPGGGAFGTYVRMDSWRTQKIPEDMSSTDAASLPIAYFTAIFAIMRIGRLRKEESVLIHAASGAVGQACIVLAKHIGARIFATAGTPDKREFLHKTFGIPEEQIFSSRTPDFRDGILCATDSKGVDVIVNSLSDNLLQETWALIGDFGRFVEIGKKDSLRNSYLGMRPFDRNVTFSGIDIQQLFDRRPDVERECCIELLDLVQRRIVVPIRPVTEIPISELATGLRRLQTGRNVGKIVITIGSHDSVLTECRPTLGVEPGQLLRPDATYVITGGTGGIGISLASWMVENGARIVILLGRSGSSRPRVRELVEKYDGTEVKLRAIACDVGSRTQFVDALTSIQDLPPVRGVIHGALYLRDSLTVNATYDDWQNITGPRVQGAWNLHELLPDVDFFVTLSSHVGSLGNIGQGIYASTASFFDAFSRHRIARGQPSVVIALPVVLGVGYVVEHGLVETLVGSLGLFITEADLYTLVKGAIIGSSSGLNRDGNAISFRPASGDGQSPLGWQYYHPLTFRGDFDAQDRCSEDHSSDQVGNTRGNTLRVTNGGNPLTGVLEALIDKVSSITMIDDEVEPDTPLSTYGLDSLVLVELRNWIRRETGVELALPKLAGTANLRYLASYILSQKEVRK
ncbi:Type I Iterative PKS [Emmonsiellopsis sp. PD_5]|nr:Type I Iterative PKS [Emmonsiellopsis sp. PD_5]